MDVRAGSSTGWSRLAGATAVRGLVNLGFQLDARLRCQELARSRPVRIQERVLGRLVRKARRTRFGRDHRFDRISSVADFQREVPIRTYEKLWDAYLRDRYPVFEDLTWPGRIPFLRSPAGRLEGRPNTSPSRPRWSRRTARPPSPCSPSTCVLGPIPGCSTGGSVFWGDRPISRSRHPVSSRVT